MSSAISSPIILAPESLAIILGTFLSGTLMSLSTITIPVLLQTSTSKPLLLRQWAEIFHRGHTQGPLLAILTSGTYGYAAWLRVTAGENWVPCIVAAGLTLAIVPFTWVFMGGLNDRLFEAVDYDDKDGDGDKRIDGEMVESMIVSWTKLHAVRSLLPLVGAVVGMLGMLRYF